MSKVITDRYRCPEQFVRTSLTTPASSEDTDLHFGRDLVCYAGYCAGNSSASRDFPLADLADQVHPDQAGVQPPLDLDKLVHNLTHERLLPGTDVDSPRRDSNVLLRRLYYSVRSFLPTPLRVSLQRMYFRGWDKVAFPTWPVDVRVERLLETGLLCSMKALGIDSVPFIWFWPDGASSAAILTYDVETERGRDFCPRLMEINESFGFRSAFQVVPEERYTVTQAFLDDIRSRGHEVNVHDLNHDGNLFRDRKQFLKRVKAVNEYGRLWGAKGFRSAILYRNLDWYDALDFEYDMSVPNVGHLEVQRGGCCTTFPYLVGEILELPVTTTQDYSLFHILRQHSIDLWKKQAELILAKHGLLSFLTHPDYLLESRAQSTYRNLLAFLAELESKRGTWVALPNQVNEWWRLRSKMYLVPEGSGWRIEGPGKERARLAYARIDGDELVYVPEAFASLSSKTS